jgi:hypothetical protein
MRWKRKRKRKRSYRKRRMSARYSFFVRRYRRVLLIISNDIKLIHFVVIKEFA